MDIAKEYLPPFIENAYAMLVAMKGEENITRTVHELSAEQIAQIPALLEEAWVFAGLDQRILTKLWFVSGVSDLDCTIITVEFKPVEGVEFSRTSTTLYRETRDLFLGRLCKAFGLPDYQTPELRIITATAE